MNEIELNWLELKARSIRDFLNSQSGYLASISLNSPRAVGDAIQTLLASNLSNIFSEEEGSIETEFSRRALADLALRTADGKYYAIDIKTHNTEATFSMPNLISARRLSKFYEKSTNYFLILSISYVVKDGQIKVLKTFLKPIELLNWNCISIGALGHGQIQICDSNKIEFVEKYCRQTWLSDFHNKMIEFYDKEAIKIIARKKFFTDKCASLQTEH